MPECAEDDTFALQQVPFLKVANDRVLLLTMSESSLMECQNSVALTGAREIWLKISFAVKSKTCAQKGNLSEFFFAKTLAFPRKHGYSSHLSGT